MPDASLLTEALRGLVGRETALGSAIVTPRAFKRAVEVFTGSPPAVIPPEGAPVPGYVLAALETDSEPPGLPPIMPNTLVTADEWSFDRDLRMGELLQASFLIVDMKERFGGRFGYSIDVRSESVFRAPGGAAVARNTRTMTYYSAADGSEAGPS